MDALIALVETKEFQRKSERLLSDEERAALLGHLAQRPDAGAVIPETGGIRKLRWGARGKGKRGGVRVIYYSIAPRCRSCSSRYMPRRKRAI